MTELIYYCRDNVTVCALTDDNVTIQTHKLQSKPDIVISTPARLVLQLKNGSIDLSNVKTLVIDEADLVLSFGYTEDVHTITSKMPKIFQGLLMSATLSPELDKFKRVLLHNPAVLRLEVRPIVRLWNLFCFRHTYLFVTLTRNFSFYRRRKALVNFFNSISLQQKVTSFLYFTCLSSSVYSR